MKLAVLLAFSTTSLLAAGGTLGSGSPKASVISKGPSITGPVFVKRILLKGNKLIVTGENFDIGTSIFINNEAVRTRNDFDSPTTTLVAKKGGRKIPPEGIFGLYVETSAGTPSATRAFFNSPSFLAAVLPKWPYPFPIYLQVGDYLVVQNMADATRWDASDNIKLVVGISLPSSTDWLFQAVKPGFGVFYAEHYGGGEAPPQKLYDISIVVE